VIGGRKRPMLIYSLIFVLSVYPILKLGYSGGYTTFVSAFSVQAFLEAMIFSTLPAFLSELFSKRFRATGVGFAYNAGAIVGGFAISLIYALSSVIGLFESWLLLLIAFSLVMLVGIALSSETWRKTEVAHADKIVE